MSYWHKRHKPLSPEVPATSYLRRANALAQFELAAPDWLKTSMEALIDAFDEEYDEAGYKRTAPIVYQRPPFNMRIKHWKWRFEGGGVMDRTFDQTWVDHDIAGWDWEREQREARKRRA